MADNMAQRMAIRKIIGQTCAENCAAWEELPNIRKDALARRIERSCFNATIASCIDDGIDRLFTEKKFIERYSSICFRVISNLNKNVVAQSTLIEDILAKRVDETEIATLASDQLCAEANLAIRETIAARMSQKAHIKVSKSHTCRKCQCKETIVVEYQGRASDEASSFSIRCVNCNFIWRR